MNKLFSHAFLAVVFFVCGCKSIPTVETAYNTSKAVGTAIGLTLNCSKIDDVSRNVLIDVVNEVSRLVPETNVTFEAAWTPIATAYVEKLEKDGKIDAGKAEIIKRAFKNCVVKGIDYYFEVRQPRAKESKELVYASVRGFNEGFLAVFRSANSFSAAEIEYDEPTYEYLNGMN